MNVALWIVGVLLGVVFLAAGATKVRESRTEFFEMDPRNFGWANDFSDQQFQMIGIVEVLGGLGVILPAVTGIGPVLVPLAAAGLAVSQLIAVIVHVRRGEANLIGKNILFIAMGAFVAWGRFGDYSF